MPPIAPRRAAGYIDSRPSSVPLTRVSLPAAKSLTSLSPCPRPLHTLFSARVQPPKHVLLLNKFNVVANHMLVVTQDFEHQNDPLNEADMAVTLQARQPQPPDTAAPVSDRLPSVAGRGESLSAVSRRLRVCRSRAILSAIVLQRGLKCLVTSVPDSQRVPSVSQVLRAMPGEGGLAFYNCGEASGHSQPHKHIQARTRPGYRAGDERMLVCSLESEEDAHV